MLTKKHHLTGNRKVLSPFPNYHVCSALHRLCTQENVQQAQHTAACLGAQICNTALLNLDFMASRQCAAACECYWWEERCSYIYFGCLGYKQFGALKEKSQTPKYSQWMGGSYRSFTTPLIGCLQLGVKILLCQHAFRNIQAVTEVCMRCYSKVL